MRKLGFKRSENDYCLYSLEKGNDDPVFLLIFVDDFLICCKCQKKIHKVKQLLFNKYKMKDLAEIKTYLGINVEYKENRTVMTLDQEKYIESLAKEYDIQDCKLYNTPLEQNLKCQPAQSVSVDVKYRNLIGALLYVSSGTRPDISYAVNYLSRFQNGYDQTHFKYATRILKYLYATEINFKKKY